MKIRVLMLAASLCTRNAFADMSGMITTATQITPTYTQLDNAFWFSGSMPYVNGGITFTFPTGLFFQAPIVTISLETANYNPTNDYSAIITAVSPTSVTIRVNADIIAAIGEATTNSVTVHIWAVGTEN